jgi:hypothetical protein
MSNLLTKLLLKRLLKSVKLTDVKIKLEPTIKTADTDCKNIAGLGGQSFNPAFISWDHLYQQAYAELRQYHKKPLVIKEYLFFAYFGPLEAWCDANCQGKYLLWPTDHGIYRHFDNPVDAMLWNLTWDKPMPTIKELEQSR